MQETQTIRAELPKMLKGLHVTSMLDIPCGDFNWMKTVPLENITYTGGDIVPKIIENNKQFETERIHFKHLNLTQSPLPAADLIFVRDCLVHLSFNDIFKALENISKSEAVYLVTTTFTDRSENVDILTGQWRALNLQAGPFNFPAPFLLLNEQHSKEEWNDKSLGFWKIEDIEKVLKKRAG